MKKVRLKSIHDFFQKVESPIQPLESALFDVKGLKVYVKREDLLDQQVSGNKFRKLKYNLIAAAESGQHRLLTFGGAYSNHLAATAAAGKRFGFEVHAIIRGEEPEQWSPTLQFAKGMGVHLHFVSRTDYRKRDDADYKKFWLEQIGGGFLIPEGGSNCQAVEGVAEMVDHQILELAPDFMAVASGTGGTAAGIIRTPGLSATVLSFPVLKGEFMHTTIADLLKACPGDHEAPYSIVEGYHFGGYAKMTDELMAFIIDFEKQHDFLLDPVYTAKLFYAVFDLAQKDYFPSGSTILLIHTGGLQGRAGFKGLQVPPSIFAIPQ